MDSFSPPLPPPLLSVYLSQLYNSAQLKILTTAGCSVLVLHTHLSSTKWRALGQLVVGCILVISPSLELQQKTTDTAVSQTSLLVFGYGAVLMEVLLSGFASIYFEKVVKSTTEVVTIWERNLQLSFYSIIIYVCMIIYDCTSSTTPLVLGMNWSWLTMMVAFLGAFGGLLVAATLKYADSILKTLATAGAIVVSTVLGHFMLGSPLNYVMALGSICVIFAIFNFTFDATPPTLIPLTTSIVTVLGVNETNGRSCGHEEEENIPFLPTSEEDIGRKKKNSFCSSV